MKTIPITLITGYLGSAKTTLLNNILTNDKGYKIAVIVNDIGEVNLDAELIQKGGVVNLNNDSLVALQNGCICCTLNKDLIKQILQLSQSGKFDHIMIEASGICEPMPIVQSIVAIEDECARRGIPKVCKLDAVVCVTDALRLAREFGCGKDLKKSNIDDEDIESLLIQQIEFCDVLLLNKAGEISQEELHTVKGVVKELQPTAVIFETNYSQVDLDKIVDINLFEFEKSFNGAGWLKAMDSEVEDSTKEEGNAHDDDHDHHHENSYAYHHEHHHNDDEDDDDDEEDEHHEHHHDHHEGHSHHHNHDDSTSEEYGISTFVWQTRKPLDLKKFTNLLNNYPNVIRTKGYVWFDNQPDSAYLFEQAGKLNSLTEDSLWIASAPKQDQMDLLKANPQLAQNWDEEYGDRINQLVFIGKNMNEEQIKRQFNDCLA